MTRTHCSHAPSVMPVDTDRDLSVGVAEPSGHGADIPYRAGHLCGRKLPEVVEAE